MSSSEEDEISVNEAPVVKVVKKKKKKKKKDPNAPKRGLSSFLLYSNANRSRIKEENPEAKFGDIVSLLIVFCVLIAMVDFIFCCFVWWRVFKDSRWTIFVSCLVWWSYTLAALAVDEEVGIEW